MGFLDKIKAMFALKKLKSEKVPTKEEIEKENQALTDKEQAFEKK